MVRERGKAFQDMFFLQKLRLKLLAMLRNISFVKKPKRKKEEAFMT